MPYNAFANNAPTDLSEYYRRGLEQAAASVTDAAQQAPAAAQPALSDVIAQLAALGIKDLSQLVGLSDADLMNLATSAVSGGPAWAPTAQAIPTPPVYDPSVPPTGTLEQPGLAGEAARRAARQPNTGAADMTAWLKLAQQPTYPGVVPPRDAADIPRWMNDYVVAARGDKSNTINQGYIPDPAALAATAAAYARTADFTGQPVTPTAQLAVAPAQAVTPAPAPAPVVTQPPPAPAPAYNPYSTFGGFGYRP